MAERRPTLTASARAGVRNLRSGRKKACGAVEQKKAQKLRKKASTEIGLDSAPAHIIPIFNYVRNYLMNPDIYRLNRED